MTEYKYVKLNGVKLKLTNREEKSLKRIARKGRKRHNEERENEITYRIRKNKN